MDTSSISVFIEDDDIEKLAVTYLSTYLYTYVHMYVVDVTSDVQAYAKWHGKHYLN